MSQIVFKPVKTKASKGVQCPECLETLSRSSDLSRHMKLHDPNPEMLSCPHCSFKTRQKSNLTTHINGHTGAKPHHCPSCDFATGDPGMLTKHRRRLHGYIPKQRQRKSKVPDQPSSSDSSHDELGKRSRSGEDDAEESQDSTRVKRRRIAEDDEALPGHASLSKGDTAVTSTPSRVEKPAYKLASLEAIPLLQLIGIPTTPNHPPNQSISQTAQDASRHLCTCSMCYFCSTQLIAHQSIATEPMLNTQLPQRHEGPKLLSLRNDFDWSSLQSEIPSGHSISPPSSLDHSPCTPSPSFYRNVNTVGDFQGNLVSPLSGYQGGSLNGLQCDYLQNAGSKNSSTGVSAPSGDAFDFNSLFNIPLSDLHPVGRESANAGIVDSTVDPFISLPLGLPDFGETALRRALQQYPESSFFEDKEFSTRR
ncbi:hypothetical protein AMATHDRAFT_58709 [Amanita thiersii Skay4041]|uniref:C2H2-type domain-containing protein n=1 Tax=Amanita thiersii Skay4041 TaxID=703135 RepID=A0A2A9NKU9_9AGAR|nr:hypothetical protein AMATHDRAFT_58709 [Amanita thiersii Skay4041]